MPGSDDAILNENFPPFQPFLPGRLPLHGQFARFDGVLYACRSAERGETVRSSARLVLIDTVQRPGPQWALVREYPGSGRTQWNLAVSRSRVQETFFCQGRVQWRGLEIGGLDYLPEGNLVGGYLGAVPPQLEPQLEGLHRLERVDRSTWHGYVPLDDVERLEIRREPRPDRLRPRRLGWLK